MYERDKDTKSHVATFRHGDTVYEHSIFIADDDRVECVDRQGNIILTYDADCNAYVGSKKEKKRQRLGKFGMREHFWYFVPEGEPDRVIDLEVRDVLRGEVTITKMYLDGEFKIKPAAKESAA
jgi:hypothetical protein